MTRELLTCPRCGTYTTAPTHCGRDVSAAAVCACGCRATDHAYRAATKRNSGRCLQRACGCGSYEEREAA